MKKLLAILLVISALIINGCGGGENEITPDDNVSSSLKVTDDKVTLDEDSSKSIDVLANDENALSIKSVTTPANGIAEIVGDKVLYTPNANFNGSDSFKYIAKNDKESAEATVYITVNAVNDAPIIDDIANRTINEDSPAFNVDINASDIDNDNLTINATSSDNSILAVGITPNSRSLKAISALTTITLIPQPNANGEVTISVVANDGELTTTKTFLVTINPINDAPSAVDDSAVVDEDNNITIDVLANDSDIDGDSLIIKIKSTPANGVATIIGNKISYRPNSNYNGNDSFSYTISDPSNAEADANVNITINPVNDAPTIEPVDDVTINEDTNKTINLSVNDIDGDPITITAISSDDTLVDIEVNGDTLTIIGEANRYNQNGISITVEAKDDKGASTSIDFNLIVLPVNDAPIAVDDNIEVDEDNNITIDVLSNDSDIDGDSLNITNITAPQNGEVSIVNNKIVYTPNSNYNGSDSFSYTISDGSATADATVNITVNAVNDTPIANDDSATLQEDSNITIDVLANDSDIDGDNLTVTAVTNPSNGSAVIENNKIVYTPNANYYGEDSFGYTISDNQGAQTTGSVTLNITSVNDAPIANAGDDKTTGINVAVDINGSATDIDGNITSYLWKENDTVLANSKEFSYTPTSEGDHNLTLYVTDDKNATSSDSMIVTAVATYSGAAAPGDFARYYIDSNNILSYHLSGAVFNDISGELPIIPLTDNNIFFVADLGGGEYLKLALSNNLGIAIVPVGDGESTMVTALKVTGSTDTTQIVNKNYIYAEISNEGVEGSLLRINADNSYTLYFMDGSSENGCWKVLNDHLVAKESSDCSDVNDTSAEARIVIKPGVSRAGIVVDLVDGSGFGVGLEQKAIQNSEMVGEFEAYETDGEKDNFYKIEVKNDDGFYYIATPYECNENGCVLNSDEATTGEIAINQLCDGTNIDGVMCVDLGYGLEYGGIGFIDPEDGYFMLSAPGYMMFGVKTGALE